jgi:hypothetical protein
MSGGDLVPLSQWDNPAAPPTSGLFCHSKELNKIGDWSTKFSIYRDERDAIVAQFFEAGGFYFFNRVILRGADGGAGEPYPIDPNSPTENELAGIIDFPVDIETVLQLTWGNGQIHLGGLIQPGNPLSDSIICQPWERRPSAARESVAIEN